MPAHRLDKTPSTIPRFAVVAKYTQANEGDFVQHVALLQDESSLEFGSEAVVHHCAPPIVAGARTSEATDHKFDRTVVHIVGYLNDLSGDEIAGIETTLAEIDAQTPPAQSYIAYRRQYHVHPPVDWVVDRNTGIKRFRKFSCVGFVQHCYEFGIGTRLLDDRYTLYPVVELSTLTNAYGQRVEKESTRKRLGIIEPYQIVLAGYLLHSLNRSSEEVRSEPHLPSGIHEASFSLESENDA